MAQVESAPGKSVPNGSVTVVASAPASPSQTARNTATNTVVVYNQNEPGKHDAQRS